MGPHPGCFLQMHLSPSPGGFHSEIWGPHPGCFSCLLPPSALQLYVHYHKSSSSSVGLLSPPGERDLCRTCRGEVSWRFALTACISLSSKSSKRISWHNLITPFDPWTIQLPTVDRPIFAYLLRSLCLLLFLAFAAEDCILVSSADLIMHRFNPVPCFLPLQRAQMLLVKSMQQSTSCETLQPLLFSPACMPRSSASSSAYVLVVL